MSVGNLPPMEPVAVEATFLAPLIRQDEDTVLFTLPASTSGARQSYNLAPAASSLKDGASPAPARTSLAVTVLTDGLEELHSPTHKINVDAYYEEPLVSGCAVP